MKHSSSPVFLQEYVEKSLCSLKEGVPAMLEVGCPSLLPFVLSGFPFPLLVVCPSLFFDEIVGSFGLNPGDCIGVPFLSAFDRGPLVVRSYHRDLFAQSSVRLSSDLFSVRVCLVDERALETPIIYKPLDKNFSLGGPSCDFKSLLSFLSINGYKRVESVSSPGEFVVRIPGGRSQSQEL